MRISKVEKELADAVILQMGVECNTNLRIIIMEEMLRFFESIRRHQTNRITLGEIIKLAGDDPFRAVEWLGSDEAADVNGVLLDLCQDVVDGSNPNDHPKSIWDGSLIIEDNAFYWSGVTGTNFSAKKIKDRVHLHSVFEIVR